MKKHAKKYLFVLAIVTGFIGFLGLIGFLTHESTNNTFLGVWVNDSASDELIVFSKEYVPSKGSGNDHYQIHLVDLESGKIVAKSDHATGGFSSVELIFKTQKHFWIKVEDEWKALNVSSMEESFDQKDFFESILHKNKGIGTIHELWFDEIKGVFIVENNQAEKFEVDPVSLKTGVVFKNDIQVFDSYNQLGYSQMCSTPSPSSQTEEFITIETISEQDENAVFETEMTLEDKLKQDKGFAKNYAVFTQDSVCLLLDGNKKRILRVLESDRDSLQWRTIIKDVWLNGQLLRPEKRRKDIPENRCVIEHSDLVFIFYHSSLDEAEDECHLSAINFKSEEKVWDISLEAVGVGTNHRPTQNMIYKDEIITVWLDDHFEFIISSISTASGKVNWTFVE